MRIMDARTLSCASNGICNLPDQMFIRRHAEQRVDGACNADAGPQNKSATQSPVSRQFWRPSAFRPRRIPAPRRSQSRVAGYPLPRRQTELIALPSERLKARHPELGRVRAHQHQHNCGENSTGSGSNPSHSGFDRLRANESRIIAARKATTDIPSVVALTGARVAGNFRQT